MIICDLLEGYLITIFEDVSYLGFFFCFVLFLEKKIKQFAKKFAENAFVEKKNE